MDRSLLKPLLLSLAVTLLVAGFFVTNSFQSLEYRSIDHRFAMRGPRPVPADVAIVEVDEKSIKEMGRFPWPRHYHAKLIDRLTKAGAKAIAFDILFLEDDKDRPWADAELGRAAARSGRVVFGMLFQQGQGGRPVEPAFPIEALHGGGNVSAGTVNFIPETDGVCRKVPAWVDYQDGAVPSLSLAAYAVANDLSVADAINELQIPQEDPDSPWKEFSINYVGGYQSFPYHSFADVLKGRVPDEAFKDKTVFVGGTATGLFDFKAVPNVSYFPGLEIHANAYENYELHSYLKRVNALWTLLFILLFGLASGYAALRTPTWAGLISAGLIFGYYAASQFAFSRHDLILDFVWPVMTVVGSYLVVFFYRFRTERKQKQQLRAKWGEYMAPEVIDVVMKTDVTNQLVGQDREMTVFFSDLVGFTTISENMTPKELVSVLNEYLTEMSAVIFRYGGILDKFIGDAIMAFWNAPLDQPNHAALACLTALDQVDKLKALQVRFAERKLPLIDFRAGINTGHMVVGNMGSDRHKNFTVMGDSVNLASRLESANKSFRTRLMVSEFTYEKAKGEVEVRPLDLLRVKGKNVPIQVYELLSRKGALTPEQEKAYASYKEGLAFYKEKKFPQAIESMKKTLAALPDDGPAKLYIERCENFIAFPPPPAWDGVYVMTTK